MKSDPQATRFAFADRSERGKLRLTGPQRGWYLHQVTSQVFDPIAAGESRVASMLTHTGRMTGLFEAIATDDAILCHFEAGLIPELPDAIRKYVFATQVEIEDVTDSMGLVLVLDPDPSLDLTGLTTIRQDAPLVGHPAFYLWVERASMQDLMLRLKDAGAVELDDSELETIRIASAVPRWGFEMDAKTFPQEAGIDRLAVHYDKGCYTGQEAMAKIHFRGKVNRKLARVESEARFERGQEIVAAGDKVGVVTSGSVPTSSGYVGLALVKHSIPDGTKGTVAEGDVVIEAVG